MMNAPPISPAYTMPTKTQRTDTPNTSDAATKQTDDAIERRRAQLGMLQQSRYTGPLGTTQSSTNALLQRAQNQLSQQSKVPPVAPSVLKNTSQTHYQSGTNGSKSGGSSLPNSLPGSLPGSGPPTPNRGVSRVRHSDIFPQVPKLDMPSQNSAKPVSNTRIPAAPPVLGKSTAPVARKLDETFKGGTPTARANNASGNSNSSGNNNSTNNAMSGVKVRPPPPPPNSRSKSAPPVRPPGPPPPRNQQPSQKQQTPGQTRGFMTRPPAVTINSVVKVIPPSTTIPPVTPGVGLPTPAGAKDRAGKTPFAKLSDQNDELTPPLYTENAGKTPFASKLLNSPTRDDSAIPPPVQTPEDARFGFGHADNKSDPQTTVRKDMFNTIRQFADTPPTKNLASSGPHVLDSQLESPELRMQKELSLSERQKTDALRQIKKLEDELAQLKQNGTSNTTEAIQSDTSAQVRTMLQILGAQGDQAAVQWVQDQVKNGPDQGQPTVTFSSPVQSLMSPGFGSPMAVNGSKTRKRTCTPFPKRRKEEGSGIEYEKDDLIGACESSPHEFTSDDYPSITFRVRMPFGFDKVEQKFWFSSGQLGSKMYQIAADVTKTSSIEVAAIIALDDTVLLLYDDYSVRQHNNKDGSTNAFGNVEELDGPLGNVTYTGSDGQQHEYSLDEVVDSLIQVRDLYCSSIISAASVLHRRPLSVEPPLTPLAANEHPPLTTVDSGVQADSMPLTQTITPVKESAEVCIGTEDMAHAQPQQEKSSTREAPPPMNDADVMTTFLGMFVSSILWVLYTIFIWTPVKIVTTTLFLAIAVVILSIVWTYIAESRGQGVLNSPLDVLY